MKGAKSYHVAVIGAGVFGAWISFTLRRRGKKVLLLDAYGPGHSRSSSGGETRIIRVGYGRDELYSRFALRSLRLWRTFFRAVREPLLVPTRMLWLARNEDRHPAETMCTFKRLGLKFEKLAPKDLRKHFPQFSFEDVDWGLLEPAAGVLLARRAVQIVAAEAVRNGVDYMQEMITLGDRCDRPKTPSGDIVNAESFVFACGAWLPKLFPEILGRYIFPTRQEVFFFAVPPGDCRFSPASLPAWYSFADEVYGLPDIENRGIKVAFDRHGPAFDPDTGERFVTESAVQSVTEIARKYFPALKEPVLSESRVCQYENTSNGDLLIDCHPQFRNVWLVGGGSGHGFKHAPAVGEYVAGLIAGNIRPERRFALATKRTVQSRQVV